MGRRRKENKIQMNNDCGKASSSSKENRNAKTEERRETKKLKSETTTQAQVEIGVKQSSVNDLPQEMLMKILKNVDSENLLSCRLVNRNWNLIASEICRSRSTLSACLEIKINCFKFNTTRRSGNKRRPGKRSLAHFLKLFENSINFPYSRFFCHVDEKSTFDQPDWTKFISDFGRRIKCLKLGIIYYSTFGLREIEWKLRVLLFTQLPNLQEFGLQTQIITRCIQTSVKRGKVAPAGGLPNLKALYFDSYLSSSLEPIARDLLHAAVNLQSISTLEKGKSFINPTEVFHFFQSHGKLECLGDAQMKLTPYFLSRIRENKLLGASAFKLKELKLETKLIQNDTSVHGDATLFLSNLFESSKDTLNKLTMEPIGFLSRLQFPTFSKLTNLTITENINSDQILPVGIKALDVFPLLHSLELEIPWTTVFPQADSFNCFPTVKNLKVVANGMRKTAIAQISQVCPNLKNFSIGDKEEPIDNFPEVGTAIWTHMKQVQTLKLGISANFPANAFPAVDSCITGFSGEECIRLYNLNNKTVKASQSSEVEDAERETESILNMKNLRSLTVELIPFKIRSTRTMLNKALTFVSQEYALKLMDNLTYKIERDFA